MVLGLNNIKDAALGTVVGVFGLVSGHTPVGAVSGPINNTRMAYRSAAQAFNTHNGLIDFLGLLVAFSIGVGLLNLLPIPMLDGSRIVFVTIEAIRKKAIPREKEAMVHLVGLVFIILLVIVVSVHEISAMVAK